MSAAERNGIGGWHNRESYEECFARHRRTSSPGRAAGWYGGIGARALVAFPEGRKVAYLSLDMNIVVPEIAAIEFFFRTGLCPAPWCCSMTMAGRRMQPRRRRLTPLRVRMVR